MSKVPVDAINDPKKRMQTAPKRAING